MITKDMKRAAPGAVYECACFSEHFPPDDLFWYPGWEQCNEGFYCAPCVEGMEDDRYHEEGGRLQDEMVDDLVSEGADPESAREAAEEMFPFERLNPHTDLYSLSAVMRHSMVQVTVHND